MPAPSNIALPTPPIWEAPPVLVITPAEAETYQQFCELFKTPEDDLGDIERIQKKSLIADGSDADDFCHWAVYGFTVQDWLSFEEYMIQVAGYVEKLKQSIQFYESQLDARQSLVEEAEKYAQPEVSEPSS